MTRATSPDISSLLHGLRPIISSSPISSCSGVLRYAFGTTAPCVFSIDQIFRLAIKVGIAIPKDVPFLRLWFLGYSKKVIPRVERSEKTVFRLCDAVTDFIFYFLDKVAATNLLNHKCSELGNCYQRQIKDTVLSKFQDSVKLVIPELSKFLNSFLDEVCGCMVCVSQDAHIYQRHQKCMSKFVKKLNGKISESFEVEDQLSSRVNENGIKLEDHERHQYYTMQFLITNLLLVFKSLMQRMVWYLIHTMVKTKTEFLSQSEFESFSQNVMHLLAWCYLLCFLKFRNLKWNPGELQDRVQSLVVKGGEILMGKRFDEPLEVRTLEENASSVVCISNSE
ncbi:hypothetical protein SLEP1_g59808 [Rubroshorea leprosula]|uniref:Uncharacterized protein n=1 Tax=Rubroshorea leprosula TaxID=152421 RepID=A0AAV5MWM8_9ROSI|nr:hypothetical protein SLEP1_g59808 [Rubroshorea leprosula]